MKPALRLMTSYICLSFGLLLNLLILSQAQAQYVQQVPRLGDWTGAVVRQDKQPKLLFGKVGFTMNHSYEMSVATMGGNVFNQNMYTNSMFFDFGNRLDGRVDLSLAHSPLGNGFLTQGKDVRFIVRNAELNYKMGERSQLSLQFSQQPYGYGNYYDRYGYRNPWQRNAMNPFYPY